jgi:acyl-ACP thioesterase
MDNYHIYYHEVNYRKELTVPALLNLMQESAKLSANSIGVGVEKMNEQGLAWVLSRLKMEFSTFPKVGESLLIDTKPIEVGRFLTQRDYWIFDDKKKEIASATSQWIVLDVEKRVMISIPDAIRATVLPTVENAKAPIKEKLQAPKQVDFKKSYTVNFHQIDFNLHTNNVVYVQWISEAVPDETLWNYEIGSLDIQFRNESSLNDVVFVETQIIDNQNFIHRIVRGSDGKDLVWAKTIWKKR